MIAYTTPHLKTIEESNITYGEMLGLIPKNFDTNFRKLNVEVRDIKTINKPLVDQREQQMREDEKSVTADDIGLDSPHAREVEVSKMLRKHERMWSDTKRN